MRRFLFACGSTGSALGPGGSPSHPLTEISKSADFDSPSGAIRTTWSRKLGAEGCRRTASRRRRMSNRPTLLVGVPFRHKRLDQRGDNIRGLLRRLLAAEIAQGRGCGDHRSQPPPPPFCPRQTAARVADRATQGVSVVALPAWQNQNRSGGFNVSAAHVRAHPYADFRNRWDIAGQSPDGSAGPRYSLMR
jgi:hypothetical protein